MAPAAENELTQLDLKGKTSGEDSDMDDIQRRVNFLHSLNLILPFHLTPQKAITEFYVIPRNNEAELTRIESQKTQSSRFRSFRLTDSDIDPTGSQSKKLRGYETLQELRDKVANFRQDYLNWRKFKPKGAKGETTDVFTKQIGLEANDMLHEHLITVKTRSEKRSPSLIEAEAAGFPPRTPSLILTASLTIDQTVESTKPVDQEDVWLRYYYNPFTPAETAPEVRLCTATLPHFETRNIQIPLYSRDPSTVTHWILHVGVGQFHRSHQEVFLDDLLTKQYKETKDDMPIKWGYCGIGLMPSDLQMANALRNQNLLYTVISRTNTTCNVRIVGSMFEYIFAHDEFEAARKKILDPRVHIISLTITEKGYFQNVHSELDKENPFIVKDLNILRRDKCQASSPRTAVGFIYWAIRERYKHGLPSITVMSCDNLPENGHVAKRMVLSFAELIDSTFAQWINDNIKFPCTMVDRITPATALEHRELLATDFGVLDEWPVVTEEFMQWAIEDNFNLRPPWEHVGPLLVSDVRPLELMKLRLLNGGHSIVGYISFLEGYQYVDDAVNDVRISSFLRAYMDEMTSTIRNVNIELERYKEKIVERFGNRMIKDRLLRLCEDGSTKFYNTMKDAILELLTEGRHVHYIALGIAAFIAFLSKASSEIIFDAKKTLLIESAKQVFQQPQCSEHVKEFLHNVLGPSVCDFDSFVNHVSLSVVALQYCSVTRVLDCGGTLEALLDAHFKHPQLYMKLLSFATGSIKDDKNN